MNSESNALDAAEQLLKQVRRTVLGQDEAVRQLVIAFLARGHALLQGVPGTAKTLAVRTMAQAIGLTFGRVQFTPDLMPADVIGTSIFVSGAFQFRAGPVFTDILLADEINRAPPRTQAALLEAMQERQATVDGVSHPLPRWFTVFATQNPVEFEGTYPLPEAELDRFLLRVDIGFPDAAAERAILDLHAGGFNDGDPGSWNIQPMSASDRDTLMAAVDGIRVDPQARDYITRMVRATREHPAIRHGASPRAAVALFRAARAEALLSGRGFVTPDDVKRMAAPVLRHRLALDADAELEGTSTDSVLAEVMERVPAPAAIP